MKQLTCEMCGSTELLKQDGVFVCQTCGTKYSVEEAKKMMVEGTVEVTGTVKVDNSAAIENYLKMAKSALESSNNEEAENYANKIIELDPKCSAAWEIKGEAAGWQSKTINNRLPEAVTAWITAVEYANDDEKNALRLRIAQKYCNLFRAMISLYAGNFESIQSEDNLNSTIIAVNNGVFLMNNLVAKADVSFNRATVYNQIAEILNEKACGGYKDAQNDFGPEHHQMQKWQWNNFTAACDNCIKMLERAVELVRDNSLGIKICNNMIFIGETARDSKSWKFNVNSWNSDNYDVDYTFTDEAKKSRTKNIDSYKEKKKKFEADQATELINELQSGRKATEIELAKQKYWEEHKEEKAKLESNKKDLENENNSVEKEISNLRSKISKLNEESNAEVPADKDKKSVMEKISELNKQKSSLGLFKGKEKKQIQEKIDIEQSKLSDINKVIDAQKKERKDKIDIQIKNIENEISPLSKKQAEISNKVKNICDELTKSRGQISTKGICILEDAIKDMKFNFSCEQFFEHLKKIIPAPYTPVAPVKQECQLSDEMNECYYINFINENISGDNKNIGVGIFLEVSDNANVIRRIVVQGPYSKYANELKAWCSIGAFVLMSLAPNLSQDDAEQIFCNLALSDSGSWYGEDDVSIEYADYIILQFQSIVLRNGAAILKPNIK